MDSKQKPVERALAGYRQLVELTSASRAPDFPEPGITMAQMRVLMLLSTVGEQRMSDLAGQLGAPLSTLSSLADRLVDGGLAQRRPDPADRRGVLVSIAPAGKNLLETFQELGEEHLRRLLAELTTEEARAVSHAIDLLVAAARRLNPVPQPPEEPQ